MTAFKKTLCGILAFILVFVFVAATPISVFAEDEEVTISAKEIELNKETEDGYEFSSWEPDAPHNKTIESDMTFTAVCSKVVVPPPVEEPAGNEIVDIPDQPEEPPFSNVKFDGGEHGRIKGLDTVRCSK